MYMSNEQIVKMLSDLIKSLDYDLYKEMFVHADWEYDVGVAELIRIVRAHLEGVGG